jgi:protein-tyrosine phosphatase
MAQGILEHKVAEKGLNVSVDSAGTSDYHVGEAPDHRAIKKSKEYGIDISHYRGRQINADDFKTFDRILVMDASNYENTLLVAEGDDDKKKVEMILNLSNPKSNMSVPDPYFGEKDGFENVYRLVDAACDVLIEQIENEQS